MFLLFCLQKLVLAIENSTMNSIYKYVEGKKDSNEESEKISGSQGLYETNLTSQNSTEDVCVFANIKSPYDEDKYPKKFYYINKYYDFQPYVIYWNDCNNEKYLCSSFDFVYFLNISQLNQPEGVYSDKDVFQLTFSLGEEIILGGKMVWPKSDGSILNESQHIMEGIRINDKLKLIKFLTLIRGVNKRQTVHFRI
ncbi:MAG: hypothetical protein KatS3mg090_0155 [Patescibacteria group bacterium]|nr:MAG: hypothetical protein KatS3mg090_0155 [Patescibacteria group bacterium]